MLSEEVDRLALMAIALASAMLGIVVYHRAPDRVWNRLFTVHAFAVSVWVMLNYLIQSASTAAEAELWIRLTHPIVAVVICTCLDLFWVFPDKIDLASQKHRQALYGIGLMFSTFGILPNLLTSVELSRGTVLATFGWPYIGFGLFTVATLGYADYVLIRKIPRLTGMQRVQVIYVLVGMILSQGIAVVTMVVLPLVWDNTFYSRWGSAGYIFMIGFMAYAIAKHRIVRPVVALYRISALALTGAAAALLIVAALKAVQPIAAAATVPPLLVYLIAGISVGLLAVPAYDWLRRALDRGLPHARAPEAIKQASDGILRTLDAEQLPEFLSATISRILYPSHVSVLMRDRVGGHLTVTSQQAMAANHHTQALASRIAPDSVLVKAVLMEHDLIERSQVLRFHSLEEAKQIVGLMRELDTEIAAPIMWEDQLIGMVLIGEKLSGEMYAPEELAMIRNLMPQVSLAVRNAQLYNEVVRMKEYNDNILSEMKSGVIAVDADENIVLYNPAAEQMLGIAADQLLSRKLYVLPDRIAQCLRRGLSDFSSPAEYRFQLPSSNGTAIPVSCSTTGWAGSPLSQKGAMVVISDLTLVQELERERQQAEHLALIRVLSAGMAHEIRNPLVAIRTFAELLPTRWEDSDFRDNFLGTAQSEIERIDRLLADLLMLSKPADAVTETIDMAVVCQGVMRAMFARAESRNVELVTDLQADGRKPIGDPSRMHQALLNLVTNAVEAEPPAGMVRVSTRNTVSSDGHPVMVVTVYNPNSYIPEDQLEQIFKPFYSRRFGGTGLGLAICQTIIEEHQGTISVYSRPSYGTEFAVQLPLGPEDGERPHVAGTGQ